MKPGKLEISNLSRATPESPQVYHLSRRLQLVYVDDSTPKVELSLFSLQSDSREGSSREYSEIAAEIAEFRGRKIEK